MDEQRKLDKISAYGLCLFYVMFFMSNHDAYDRSFGVQHPTQKTLFIFQWFYKRPTRATK